MAGDGETQALDTGAPARVRRGQVMGAFAAASSYAVAALFVSALVLLAAMAALSVSHITFGEKELSEHTFYLAANPLVDVVAMAVLVAVAYGLSKTAPLRAFREALEGDRFFRRCRVVVLAALFCLSCLWIAGTLAVPGADQKSVQKAALAALQADWSAFSADGYMSMYPNQIGLFWISLPLAAVFGKYASAVFMAFNAVGLVVACSALGSVAARMGATRLQQLATMALCIAFYPLIQYCSFVYGTVWGFALSLLAIRFEMDFFERRKARYAVASAACIAAALVFKSNYQVFLIGMVLYALVEVVDARMVKGLLAIVLLAGAYGAASVVPVAAAEAASGMEVGAGCSTWSWVAMGLQDGVRAPGWYNAYNRTSYAEADHDTEAQAQAAKRDIAQSLSDFASGKRSEVVFFTRKVASQWNNPTMQGYWNVQVRRAAFPVNPLVKAMVSGKGVEAAVTWYLGPLQFAIVCGALAWAVLARWREPRKYRQLVLALVFLGGFVCHVFWEGKCQYVLPYFVLLFPYASMGLARLVRALSNVGSGLAARRGSALDEASRLRENVAPRPARCRMSRDERPQAAPIAVFATSCVLVAALFAAGGYAAITGDAQAYGDWMASGPKSALVDGKPATDLLG